MRLGLLGLGLPAPLGFLALGVPLVSSWGLMLIRPPEVLPDVGRLSLSTTPRRATCDSTRTRTVTTAGCGIDLHARTMFVCILDAQGQKLVERNGCAVEPRARCGLVCSYGKLGSLQD